MKSSQMKHTPSNSSCLLCTFSPCWWFFINSMWKILQILSVPKTSEWNEHCRTPPIQKRQRICLVIETFVSGLSWHANLIFTTSEQEKFIQLLFKYFLWGGHPLTSWTQTINLCIYNAYTSLITHVNNHLYCTGVAMFSTSMLCCQTLSTLSQCIKL